MEQVNWLRVAVNGAMLTVCSTECLDLLGRVRWIDDYLEGEVRLTDSCVYCYQCGNLMSSPRWCVVHELSCPEVEWALTERAQDFAAAYTTRRGRAISPEIWELAELEHYHWPWLTGAELAERMNAL